MDTVGERVREIYIYIYVPMCSVFCFCFLTPFSFFRAFVMYKISFPLPCLFPKLFPLLLYSSDLTPLMFSTDTCLRIGVYDQSLLLLRSSFSSVFSRLVPHFNYYSLERDLNAPWFWPSESLVLFLFLLIFLNIYIHYIQRTSAGEILFIPLVAIFLIILFECSFFTRYPSQTSIRRRLEYISLS